MLPIRTERLTLRMLREGDLATFVGYRNEPDVARYQDWDMPYASEAGESLIRGQADFDGPTPGQWVQIAITLSDAPDVVVGDLALGLDTSGGVAALGYTLLPEHQRRGYATEAASALIDALAATGVRRFFAELDADNVASMQLLERLGFTQEALVRDAQIMRGEWVDNLTYAMLADERRAWRDRTRTTPDDVRLVEITPDDAHVWGQLATHHSQRRFVSPMATSFRDALFPEVYKGAPVVPWLRGIEADGERAGFMMVADVTEHHPEPYLWRLLIDRWHQRRGIGDRALALLFDRLRDQGAVSASTSWVDGPGGPRAFYERLGFVPTGEIEDGEIVARLVL